MIRSALGLAGVLLTRAQEPARRGFCYSDDTQERVYFSEVFESRAPLGDLAHLFDGFLKQTYGYVAGKRPVVCVVEGRGRTAAEQKQTLQGELTENQKKLVEANWKPSAEQEKALTESRKP